MFDKLSNQLSRTLRNILGQGYLTKKNIKNALSDVRIALLEADVALPVVKEFINEISKSALGKEVRKNLTPSQEFIDIVHYKLIEIMGREHIPLNLKTKSPAVILLVGLQGSGKTTNLVKLGVYIKKNFNKKILIVSSDIYRPAAIQQLKILANYANIDFFTATKNNNSIEIVQESLIKAKLQFYDVLLVDTAGCLKDSDIVNTKILNIYNTVNPIEILLVVDSMTGQNSLNTANNFKKVLPITGIILSKIDGDSRGGAALSIQYVTKIPIKFVGIGEKYNSIEPFYPDRLAGRILGMGDILSLIDDIKKKTDYKKTSTLLNKLKNENKFDLSDFLEQIKQIKNIGGVANIISKLPILGNLSDEIKLHLNDKVLVHTEAIINSMTLKERKNPKIIRNSRKIRIANGCGMKIQDINILLKKFNDMNSIMKKTKKNNIKDIIKNIKNMI